MYSGGLYVHLERQENLSLNLSWLTEGCKTVFPSPPQHSLSSSQVPPQADLLLIVFLLTAKFSPQSCFWGYNHVLFYAWGLYCFEFFLQASACQTNKKNKQTNKTFSSLWPVLFPPAFIQPPSLSLLLHCAAGHSSTGGPWGSSQCSLLEPFLIFWTWHLPQDVKFLQL